MTDFFPAVRSKTLTQRLVPEKPMRRGGATESTKSWRRLGSSPYYPKEMKSQPSQLWPERRHYSGEDSRVDFKKLCVCRGIDSRGGDPIRIDVARAR
jgi:hypothetical protein